MTQLIKNAARAALTAAVAAADTSLTVDITKADLFPAANTGTDPVNTVGKDWFKIVVEDASHNYEIMYVRTRTLGSAIMSNLLRGQEGTTAISFASNSIVGLRITAIDYQNAIDLAAVATTFGKSILAVADAAATRVLLGFSTFFSSFIGVANAGAARVALDAAQYANQDRVASVGGTVDTITLTLSPASSALDSGLKFWRAAGSNTSTTPTVNTDSHGAKTLVKGNGLALVIGDIPGAGAWMCSQYDTTSGNEVLLNPATGVIGSGRLVGTIFTVPATSAPTGSVKVNGPLLSRTTYAALWAFAQASGNVEADDATWVANHTANGTNGKFSPGDGSTTFRIPDVRGDFQRFWSDGSTVDSGRAIGSFQADEFKSHTHTTQGTTTAAIGTSVNAISGGGSLATSATGGSETRPRNTAWLACMWY